MPAGARVLAGDVVTQVSELLSLADLPGGISEIVGCTSTSPAPIPGKLVHGTLGDALQQVLAAFPGFRVAVRDGVVNVEPIGGMPPIMATPIAQFNFKGAREEAQGVISSMPELRSAEKNQGMREAVYGGGGLYAPHPADPGLDIHLKGTTVVGVLNAFARAETQGVWVFAVIKCQRNYVQVRFTNSGHWRPPIKKY